MSAGVTPVPWGHFYPPKDPPWPPWGHPHNHPNHPQSPPDLPGDTLPTFLGTSPPPRPSLGIPPCPLGNPPHSPDTPLGTLPVPLGTPSRLPWGPPRPSGATPRPPAPPPGPPPRRGLVPGAAPTLSKPFSSSFLPSTSPIPANDPTGFSPIGSATKSRCFWDVDMAPAGGGTGRAVDGGPGGTLRGPARPRDPPPGPSGTLPGTPRDPPPALTARSRRSLPPQAVTCARVLRHFRRRAAAGQERRWGGRKWWGGTALGPRRGHRERRGPPEAGAGRQGAWPVAGGRSTCRK